MTDETTGESQIADAPLPETADADSSPAVETTVETPPANDTSPQPRDEDGKFLSANAQKRIDELTREKYERAREAEYWRQQAMQHQPKPEPKVEAPAKLPTLEEHGYDEGKYQAAILDYAAKQAESVVERRLTERDQQQKEQARLTTFAERQREFAKSTPDFEARVLQDVTLPISETMRDVIIDSDTGPEIAYYLANNREAAEAISRLPTHLAALEMGRIEGRLSAQKEAAKRPTAPTVTKAPPPPPKVDASDTTFGSVKASDPGSDSLSIEAWRKARTKEVQRKSK